jgi:transcription antitermination factor NusG
MLWNIIKKAIHDIEMNNDLRFGNQSWERIKQMEREIIAHYSKLEEEQRVAYQSEIDKLKNKVAPPSVSAKFKVGDRVIVLVGGWTDYITTVEDVRWSGGVYGWTYDLLIDGKLKHFGGHEIRLL